MEYGSCVSWRRSRRDTQLSGWRVVELGSDAEHLCQMVMGAAEKVESGSRVSRRRSRRDTLLPAGDLASGGRGAFFAPLPKGCGVTEKWNTAAVCHGGGAGETLSCPGGEWYGKVPPGRWAGETVRKLKTDYQIAQKMSAKTIEKPLKGLKYHKKLVHNAQVPMSFRTLSGGGNGTQRKYNVVKVKSIMELLTG